MIEPISKEWDEARLGLKTMYLRHYELHEGENEVLRAEKDSCHYCQLRLFTTHPTAPIAIINTINNQTLPPNFKFISRSTLHPSVEAAPDVFRSGCECSSNHHCKRRGCHCLEDMVVRNEGRRGRRKGANGEREREREKIYVYCEERDRRECLRDEVLESRDAIYECHSKCACTVDCRNRVVERGRKVPLQIFMTGDGRGWGVKSPIPLQKGQFVDLYFGEILPSATATARRAASTLSQRKDVYLFALDKFSDATSHDDRLRGAPLEVDGEFLSGPTRFINHSCEPNLRIFARVGDHADKHIHDLAFFAVEDVDAGMELTFDYVDGGGGAEGEGWDWEGDVADPEKVKDMTECLCGKEGCRKFLW